MSGLDGSIPILREAWLQRIKGDLCKGTAMKRSLVALGLMTLAACASVPEQTTVSASTSQSVAEWETWKANENAVWSSKEFAILKIDDAIYLKDGESAWLTTRRQKVLSHRWLLGQPRSGGHFVITYTGDKAKVFDRRTLKEYDLAETQTVKLGNGIDVRFARTQISPGGEWTARDGL
jgi:hypothetical protein